MTYPRKALQNKRVVLSDSESDFDDDCDVSTDDANATKRSQGHPNASTKPGAGGVSDNSYDDDLHGSSGESDEETPSATSNMKDKSYRNATTPLDNDAPGQIRATKTVQRKLGDRGIELHNITSPLPRASNEYYSLQNDQERSGKRQRLRRGSGRKIVSYDIKHHLIDDVLQPKYSAKRRGIVKQVPDESSDSNEEVDEDNENDAPSRKINSSIPHRRRSSRNIRQSKKPNYSAKWHPLDQMLKENTSSSRDSKKGECSMEIHKSTGFSSMLKDEEDSVTANSDLDLEEVSDRVSELGARAAPLSPNQRRSARVLSKGSPPNYDMKYHIMDSTLRPTAAAKQMKSKLQSASSRKTLSKSSSSTKNHIEQLAEPSPESLTRCAVQHESDVDGPNVSLISSWSQLRNPYLSQTSLSWAEIHEMDRYACLLQNGAPLHDNTLSQDCTNDFGKKSLFDKGIDTPDELSSRDSSELLKIRYESVRIGLQNSFASTPEPVNENSWTLFKDEGLEIYDQMPGSQYWKHQRDNVVEGSKASSSSNSIGYTNEIARHMAGYHNWEVPDTILEKRDRNEGIKPISMRNVINESENLNKSDLKSPPALEFDAKRRVTIEDDSEKGVFTETEDSLMESMRGKHVPFPVMSDTALEKLLSSAEQYLAEENNHEITADLVPSDSKAFEPARVLPACPDNTLNERSPVASKAKALDLGASSDCGLDETIQVGKESTTGFPVGTRGRYGEPRTPKTELKTRKRKSRADRTVAIHEDLPGRTPLINRIVRMNPASPGTDIPKENLEDDGLVDPSSQLEIGMHRNHQPHEAITTSSTRRVGLQHMRHHITALSSVDPLVLHRARGP